MSEPIKQPQPVEKSLGYIAWSLKDIHKDLQDFNELVKDIKAILSDIQQFGVPK